MTIAEKLATIAENEQKVYDAGYAEGEKFIQTAYVNGKCITFNGSTWLTHVPNLDFSKITSFELMFASCRNLVSLPEIDASSCVSLRRFCYLARSLPSLVLKNTSSNVIDWYQSFQMCSSLKSITPALDYSGAPANSLTFSGCNALETLTFVEGSIRGSLMVPSSVLLDESIQSIIDGLADLTDGTQQTLTLNATVSAKLTEDQIATITSKNWVVA